MRGCVLLILKLRLELDGVLLPVNGKLRMLEKNAITNFGGPTQWLQTSKNIQKPPHSTLWIPGLFWPKIQKEWSAEVKLFSKISKKRQNLAKNHWENSVPLKMGRPNLDKTQPKWIGKLHSKGIMPIFRGSYPTEWKCSRFPCLNLTNFSWICKIS